MLRKNPNGFPRTAELPTSLKTVERVLFKYNLTNFEVIPDTVSKQFSNLIPGKVTGASSILKITVLTKRGIYVKLSKFSPRSLIVIFIFKWEIIISFI